MRNGSKGSNIMTTTRRTILTGLAVSPLAAAPAAAAIIETPEERVDRAIKELHAAMVAMHGGEWGMTVNHDCGVALVLSHGPVGGRVTS
jgi:hypothetical protein